MSYHSAEDETTKEPSWARRRNDVRSTLVFLVFLLMSCTLIFGAATYAIQREPQAWLALKNVSSDGANYGVDILPALQAPINPEVIEDSKQDARFDTPITPTVIAVAAGLTPSPSPTASPTFTPTPTPEPSAFTVNAGGPYQGDEGSEIEIEAESPNLVGLLPGSISYIWDFDNDGRYDDGEGAATTVIYLDEGQYTINLQAADVLGRVATDTTTISVRNVPPLVKLSPIPQLNEAQEFTLAATVEDPGRDILFYHWDFGDGTVEVLDTLTPDYTYSDNGLYTVRLRVEDNDGGVTEDTFVVEVKNLPPLAEAGPNHTTSEGSSTFTVTGAGSDPAAEFDPLTYAWDLNFDGSNFTPDVLGQSASIAYKNGPDNVTVALRVQDDDGGVNIDTFTVQVNNVAPTLLSITSRGSKFEGDPVTVEVRATDVGSDTLTYDFAWGDGSSTTDTSPQATHVWEDNGTYTVRVEVDDGDGGTASGEVDIVIENVAPTAVADALPNPAPEGTAVNFSGIDSTDPGELDALTYEWNFGDGSQASGSTVSHTYADNQVYNATLTVTDDDGGVGTTTLPITILNANPLAEAGGDRTINEGETIASFSGTATDPGSADTLSFEWDFDYDGVSFDPEPQTGPTSGSVTYLDDPDDPDKYIVALRVRDDDYPSPSGEHIDTLKVTVKNVAPQVEAGGPYLTEETIPIDLTAVAVDVAADMPDLTYEWDINGDGSIDLTGKTVTAKFDAKGTYEVKVVVKDGDGGEGSDIATVIVKNAPPRAVAGGPYLGNEGSPLLLDGSGSSDPTNDPLLYTWNFGDGTPITSTVVATIPHTYAQDGFYTVTLTVDDQRGVDHLQDIDLTTATIKNLPPTAKGQASPGPYFEGSSITFSDNGSSDPGNDPLSYSWNFGDTLTATGVMVNHTYFDEGIYNVVLTVRDNAGATNATNLPPLTVQNVAPTAVAAASVTNKRVTFDSSGSSDPGNDTLTYEWDFGDGNSTVTSNPTVNHTYAQQGTYPVTLTVRDGDGGVDIDNSLTVTVQNADPKANAGGPYGGTEGSPVLFNSSGSNDPDNDPLNYTWDFGDGSPPLNTGSPTVNHTYADDGTYLVTLTVNDGDGGVDTATPMVTIINVDPTAVAAITTNPPLNEGEALVFDSSQSSDPGNDTLTYNWDFGDGSPPLNTVSPTVNHTYADDGTYLVTLTVDDGDGGTANTSLTVTVQNVDPTVSTDQMSYTTTVSNTISLSATGSDVPADPLSYAWDLDDNGSFEQPGQTVSFNSTISGTFIVTVQVDDGDGGTATDTATVQVNSLAPLAGLGGIYVLVQSYQTTVNQLRRRKKRSFDRLQL